MLHCNVGVPLDPTLGKFGPRGPTVPDGVLWGPVAVANVSFCGLDSKALNVNLQMTRIRVRDQTYTRYSANGPNGPNDSERFRT